MTAPRRRPKHLRWALAAVSLAGLAGSTGCQVDVGGQTLPSGYYLQDDVQYYAPGPEFKLAREAAALEARRREEALLNAGGP
jgi:hypothetical protein